MALSVIAVADSILVEAAKRGEQISDMKLQKLLYYAQGEHLAATGELLFAEPIKAWKRGPVVPEIWHRYKHNGYLGIPKPADVPTIPALYCATIVVVLDRYLPFTAEQLSEMTHRERPWVEARRHKHDSPPIPKEALRSHFSSVRSARLLERQVDIAPGGTKTRILAFVQKHDSLFRKLA